MKIAVMQPYIFPYIGYFQLINEVDKFIIYDDVNFIKRGWINRNRILVNGRSYLFTIPCKNTSQNIMINESYYDINTKFQTNFLKTIEHAYKKAPFYHNVLELINDALIYNDRKVSNFNTNALFIVCNYLKIKTPISKSSEIHSESKGQDKADRLINICLKENADNYINPIGGQSIYEKKYFLKKNVNLSFMQTQLIEYEQNIKSFITGLSIIDVMMYNDKNIISEFLRKFTII